MQIKNSEVNNFKTKSFTPYLVPVFLFLIIFIVYFSPEILEGKKLHQSDIVNFKGTTKEIEYYSKQYGKEHLCKY